MSQIDSVAKEGENGRTRLEEEIQNSQAQTIAQVDSVKATIENIGRTM